MTLGHASWERGALFLSLLLEQLQPCAYGKVKSCNSLGVKKKSFHFAEEERLAGWVWHGPNALNRFCDSQCSTNPLIIWVASPEVLVKSKLTLEGPSFLKTGIFFLMKQVSTLFLSPNTQRPRITDKHSPYYQRYFHGGCCLQAEVLS